MAEAGDESFEFYQKILIETFESQKNIDELPIYSIRSIKNITIFCQCICIIQQNQIFV